MTHARQQKLQEAGKGKSLRLLEEERILSFKVTLVKKEA